MITKVHLDWALDKRPSKEHVSFKNFVIKFGFTDKESAHDAYQSLINSQLIRKRRQAKLHKAYKIFQERSEVSFWATQALKNADRMLLLSSATVAKNAGVVIQEAGFREVNSGIKRYPTELSRVESLEIIDDSDEDDSETEETSPPVIDMAATTTTTTTTTTSAPIIKDDKKRPEETEAGRSKRRRVSFGSTVSTSTSTSGSLYSYHGSETSLDSDMYVYNFLVGGGREDSGLETPWTHNDVDISKDLMIFRDRIVQENYGVSQPHEILAVNFIFLLESENQTWGVEGEVHDHVWRSMWDCVGKININNFESTTIVEFHKWAGLAAGRSFDEYSKLLRDEPPSLPLLHQVLLQLTSSQQLWTFSGLENEATFIRYLIDPCLNATFGSIKHTSSKWTTALDETRGQNSRLLFPDFSLVTQLRDRSCSLVHMEGKTAANKGLSQIWDDLTKLGQELKHSLDTMIVLEPSGPVSVIGILLRGRNDFLEPRVHFILIHF
ncbi:hypothetical protein BGZ47_002688 [Haplosporangium gracile]|nr:hypothetical protein BGZ47_002688 [Haplosporangium gracile]